MSNLKAFPLIAQRADGVVFLQNDGMDLRDYFAAKALNAVITMSWRDLDFKPIDGLSIIENEAVLAYRMADAMMKAREK